MDEKHVEKEIVYYSSIMKQLHTLTLLLIILVCTIIGLLCKDRFSFILASYKKAKVVKPGCGVDIYYNQTQIRDVALEKILAKLSTGQKMELSNCQEKRYTIATIDQLFKQSLDQITSLIFSRIKEESNFRFNVTEYEGVSVFTAKDGRQRYIIDCYAQDITQGRTTYDQRFLIDVVVVPEVQVSQKKVHRLPSYSLSYPEEDQLIPLASDVIVTGLDVLSDKGAFKFEPLKMGMLYVNSVKILNSNLVLSYKDADKLACLGGITDNTLEFTGYCGTNDPIQQTSYERNPWPTLDSEPKDRKAWPCTLVPSFCWDQLGLFPKVEGKPGCPGLRSSTEQQPLTADYWMATLNVPHWHGPNFWLFDLTRGAPASMNPALG